VKALDRWVMQLRIAQALPHIPADARLLDVGCFDGTLLRRAAPRLRSGLGLDPEGTPSTRACCACGGGTSRRTCRKTRSSSTA